VQAAAPPAPQRPGPTRGLLLPARGARAAAGGGLPALLSPERVRARLAGARGGGATQGFAVASG